MLHEETYAEIRSGRTKQEQMRTIFDAVAGVHQKKAFVYTLLQELEPHLLKEMGMLYNIQKLVES